MSFIAKKIKDTLVLKVLAILYSYDLKYDFTPSFSWMLIRLLLLLHY